MDIQEKIPSYITEKSNIVRLIIFTAVFALIFINLYFPFGVKYWFNITVWQLLFYSSMITLTGVLVVVISRMIMFRVSKKYLLSYWQYLIWVLGEVFLMAMFYALFEKLILKDSRLFYDLLKISIRNTALVLLLPYSALWLYFSWQDKKLQLDKLVQGQPFTDTSWNMVPFHDEKGILRLSVKIENLLYLEASDNYVIIHYLNKEKVSHFLLRNTLKNIEDSLKGTEIIRCHRSYIVNFEKIKIIKKDKDGLQLEFDLPSAIDIPVSKSYVENVMNTFSKFCHSGEI